MFKLPNIATVIAQSASKEGLQRNPFRVFGLRSDASSRQLDSAIKDLRVHLSLGEQGKHAFAPSDFDEGMVTQASQRMRDSLNRLCDECFWFWPLDLGAEDAALELIDKGDTQGAAREWADFLEHPQWGPIAHHNLAVLAFHESAGNPATVAAFGEHASAFLSSSACKERIRLRLRDLNDPRLPRGSEESFMHDWRLVMVRALTRSAMELSDGGKGELAGIHIRCARQIAGAEQMLADIAIAEFEPKLRDLEARCLRSPESITDVEWQSLAREVKVLAERMRRFPGLGNRADISGNEVADFLRKVAVHSHNKLDDSRRALQVLNAAREIASGETGAKVTQDISTINEIQQRNRSIEEIERLHDKMERLVNEGKWVSTLAIEELLREINSAATRCDQKKPLEVIYNNFCISIRRLAVDANNSDNDTVNAERLLGLAQKIHDDATQKGVNLGELGYKLMMDKMALDNNRRATSRPSYPSGSGGESCMVALIALLCLTAAVGYATPIAAKAVSTWVTLQLR